MTRARVLPFLALLAAACVSLTPAQELALAEVRGMAGEAARLYGLPPVDVLASRNPSDPPGSYRRGFLAVSADVLTSPFRDAVVAHELAHYVLRHDGPLRGASPEERRRDLEQRELDANAKAVEILARVRGMSEAQALRLMYEYLLGVRWALERSPRLDLAGHRPPCEEIADLLARFPQHRGWTAALQCAPPSLREG